jgi:hypothetical protein
MLEKRLIHNSSIDTSKVTVYNLKNLESYHDRQLPNNRSIVQESTSIKRLLIKLLLKLLLVFKYLTCISFSTNKVYYSRLEKLHLKLGLENILLGNIY